MNLYRTRTEWIVSATRSPFGVRALEWFFAHPIFRSIDLTTGAGIPKEAAKRCQSLRSG